jgi:hypothetical protein
MKNLFKRLKKIFKRKFMKHKKKLIVARILVIAAQGYMMGGIILGKERNPCLLVQSIPTPYPRDSKTHLSDQFPKAKWWSAQRARSTNPKPTPHPKPKRESHTAAHL